MDRLTEMEAFAEVVDQGGFTDAAHKMGLSKSAISKHVSSLENRLGARLLNRTTRRVGPTDIGMAYYDRARRVLNDAGEADALVSAMQSEPAGLLRVTCATDFGVKHLSELLPEFLNLYPQVTLDVVLCQRRVELVSEGFDLAIRVGPLEDSSLRARKLTETRMRLLASPEYLAQRGRPKTINQLTDFNLIHASNISSRCVWKLEAPNGELRQVRAKGGLCINDGQCQLDAAIAGLGIAYLPDYLSQDALMSGEVEDAMPSLPRQVQDIYLVQPYHRIVQPKVRAFVEYLIQEVPKHANAC
ncbi:LysR family transcriptional regulator [Parasedimentitalea huanghaiensis]|uniref:LysR family transcriptional regulator n=1 Tax=Parasedimentitalea huanghaiensis TaxID=2682100 RepID=A0A6L6WBX4_9RHOB|nr:LysR family transcriptional regulator [Zongyanglinia huanghaiensis]MVO15194.1 LysR family transcriptional regulator [Zongyanglinia huanghaiensis]